MDTVIVSKFANYMEKMASGSIGLQNVLSRMEAYIDRQDRVKEASVSLSKERAAKLAHLFSTTRLSTGDMFLEGYDQVKQAEAWLSDPNKVFDVIELLVSSVRDASAKTASLEVGRAVNKPKETPGDAHDTFVQDILNSRQ